jgi:hypothetical protein
MCKIVSNILLSFWGCEVHQIIILRLKEKLSFAFESWYFLHATCLISWAVIVFQASCGLSIETIETAFYTFILLKNWRWLIQAYEWKCIKYLSEERECKSVCMEKQWRFGKTVRFVLIKNTLNFMECIGWKNKEGRDNFFV